ncbi:L-aspartate oxidase, partial [Candidatus Altiarchaeota archaeon]
GCGQIYKHTTNYGGAVGDGIALAFRGGLALMDMSFMQFHPTALKSNTPRDHLPLLTESLRGEGAKIVNSKKECFMSNYSQYGDLATRDVVTRGIWKEMGSGEEVFLDTTSLRKELFKDRFLLVNNICAEDGLDPTKDLLPITPAAHYFMGGIKTDINCRTSMGGVLAVGEVGCVGVHGANRLASNSLAESLVFGKRAGIMVATLLEECKKLSRVEDVGGKAGKGKELGSRVLSGFKTKIKEIMWDNVGVVRTEDSLNSAMKELEGADEKLNKSLTFSKDYFEVRNMVQLGLLITHSAKTRKESRGAHYREDYSTRKKKWARHIIITKNH